MATRSFICKFDENSKKFVGVYCHYNGYPEDVGKELITYFNTESEINKLFSKWYISSINFGEIEFGQCGFSDDVKYHDDINTLIDFAINSDCKYFYLYRNGNWIYVDLNDLNLGYKPVNGICTNKWKSL